MTKLTWVQGAGRRKHVLIGKQGTNTVCGAWYFGKTAGTTLHPAHDKSKACAHCVWMACQSKLKIPTGAEL
jgi:hypothetical protein